MYIPKWWTNQGQTGHWILIIAAPPKKGFFPKYDNGFGEDVLAPDIGLPSGSALV
jgi:hypothetical protein